MCISECSYNLWQPSLIYIGFDQAAEGLDEGSYVNFFFLKESTLREIPSFLSQHQPRTSHKYYLSILAMFTMSHKDVKHVNWLIVPDDRRREGCSSSDVPDGRRREGCSSSDVPDDRRREGCSSSDVPDDRRREGCSSSDVPDDRRREGCLSSDVPDDRRREGCSSSDVPDDRRREGCSSSDSRNNEG